MLNGGDSVSSDIGRRLLERRLYRPLVIFAGNNLQAPPNTPSFRGTSDPARIAAELYKLIMLDGINGQSAPENGMKAQLMAEIRDVEDKLEAILADFKDAEGSVAPTGGVITYCLKPKFGYKDPLVLCRWTDNNVYRLVELPEQAKGVHEQVSAIEENYVALWRLFVFVKPEYLVPENASDASSSVVERCKKQ